MCGMECEREMVDSWREHQKSTNTHTDIRQAVGIPIVSARLRLLSCARCTFLPGQTVFFHAFAPHTCVHHAVNEYIHLSQSVAQSHSRIRSDAAARAHQHTKSTMYISELHACRFKRNGKTMTHTSEASMKKMTGSSLQRLFFEI